MLQGTGERGQSFCHTLGAQGLSTGHRGRGGATLLGFGVKLRLCLPVILNQGGATLQGHLRRNGGILDCCNNLGTWLECSGQGC